MGAYCLQSLISLAGHEGGGEEASKDAFKRRGDLFGRLKKACREIAGRCRGVRGFIHLLHANWGPWYEKRHGHLGSFKVREIK